MNDIYSVEQLSASWLDTNPLSTTYDYIWFLSFLLLYILFLGLEMCLSLANTRGHIKQMWAIVTHLKLWPANATHNFKCIKIGKPFCWTGQFGYLKMIYHPLYGMNNYVLIWGDWLGSEGHMIANHPIYGVDWLSYMIANHPI